MPSSEHWQIPRVVDVIIAEQPRSVLDVGAGWGKFGVLSREYARPERVDAIDANQPRYPVYDHVYLGDIREIDALIPDRDFRYDLALFIDTIEHLEKDQAWKLLDQLTRRARRVLITTPWGFRRQEIPGQPFETHRSGWYPWDFSKRYEVHRSQVFPGHYSKHLRVPKLWQILVLISARGTR